jgi:hypothetical protein
MADIAIVRKKKRGGSEIQGKQNGDWLQLRFRRRLSPVLSHSPIFAFRHSPPSPFDRYFFL